jgi:RNA polymerase sigma-70 factor (ECF subfamily)
LSAATVRNLVRTTPYQAQPVLGVVAIPWEYVPVTVSGKGEDPEDLAMSRYAEGDDTAFFLVHRAVAERLRAFLTRMGRSPTLADDLLQETFLRIHRARGSFDPGARVLPWCYAIARNVYIDHIRQRAVRKERQASVELDGQELEVPAGPDADGELVTMASELAVVVERTLARLPPNQREAFVLLRYEGLSVADAAGVLGATEGAVKLRAFHAYEALREALGDVAPKKRGAS